ncbi:MAG: DUF7305 domain-containing protein [Solirubrobacteraceae bacterium]
MPSESTRPMHALARPARSLAGRLRADAGFVLPTAIGVLFVIALLTTAAVATSVSTSSSTSRDEHHKAALEAAEAGLRVATYRLNMLGPESTECIAAGKALKPVSEAGECTSGWEGLGNDAEYKYWTTTELKSGYTCVGIAMTNAEDEKVKSEGIAQRCVTAVGKAAGVEARVETRVSSFSAKPVFPIPAVIGKERVAIEGNSTVKGAVASNGEIKSNGKPFQEGGCVLGPSASYKGEGGGVCESTFQRSAEEGPIVVTPIQPGSSATGSPTKECKEQVEPKYNCNFLIENGIYNAKLKKNEESKKITPADGVSGNVTYTTSNSKKEATRELTMSAGSWTPNGYIYNFCNFVATGNSTITIPSGVKVEIFVEAPESEEKGSGCPPGSGEFKIVGTVNNPSNQPDALQIYVYGKGPVTVSGNASMSMVLVAPEAPVSLSGKGSIIGGVSGKEVSLTGNFGFTWSEEVQKLKAGPAGATTSYYRTAWAECSTKMTLTSPTAGC